MDSWRCYNRTSVHICRLQSSDNQAGGDTRTGQIIFFFLEQDKISLA